VYQKLAGLFDIFCLLEGVFAQESRFFLDLARYQHSDKDAILLF